jgi:octaprenyl-diphosphate synthase
MLKYNHAIDIKNVFDAHEEELRLVEEHLRDMFKSDVFLIPLVGRHLLDSGGKRIRPLFLLSSARLAGYKGENHIALASVIETVHTASLLHDDVVDGAELRRGKPVAHSIWGNQVVILVGDFLYSKALKHAVSFKSQQIMEALSSATTSMTEGELLQLQKSGDVSITEEEYLKIISSKTGVLISAACRIGGILGDVSPEKEQALAEFGLKAGIAFQMADDILDYMADEGDLGKRLGKDLEEGKITLPLICLLKAVSGAEREEIKGMIEHGLSDDSLHRILDLFKLYNVLEESVSRAKKLVEDAKAELSVFPPSAERDEMFAIAEYALQRGK